MLRSRWIAGPADAGPGPLVASLTDYRMNSYRDFPGIVKSARSLGRLWPELPGAVGMWLWVDPYTRRVGSLSVWQGEDDLRGFVRVPDHVQIMRKYRHRGTLRSRTWKIDELDRTALWRVLNPS
ncbi:hypothetical protein DP939_01795 [Spongiactinospora rosea]|uniref:DUF3291 domain-containing protein n=1 Tax=Spongiactinospora rosea TaxID=2248750 RepID=A0A366M6W5_9ACTN|nr:hypothetical protein [Spongiactinospora rosea]RBQ21470.1 hypothetical protein DP939_01795 [Spongiactinospora rosea]